MSTCNNGYMVNKNLVDKIYEQRLETGQVVLILKKEKLVFITTFKRQPT